MILPSVTLCIYSLEESLLTFSKLKHWFSYHRTFSCICVTLGHTDLRENDTVSFLNQSVFGQNIPCFHLTFLQVQEPLMLLLLRKYLEAKVREAECVNFKLWGNILQKDTIGIFISIFYYLYVKITTLLLLDTHYHSCSADSTPLHFYYVRETLLPSNNWPCQDVSDSRNMCVCVCVSASLPLFLTILRWGFVDFSYWYHRSRGTWGHLLVHMCVCVEPNLDCSVCKV